MAWKDLAEDLAEEFSAYAELSLKWAGRAPKAGREFRQPASDGLIGLNASDSPVGGEAVVSKQVVRSIRNALDAAEEAEVTRVLLSDLCRAAYLDDTDRVVRRVVGKIVKRGRPHWKFVYRDRTRRGGQYIDAAGFETAKQPHSRPMAVHELAPWCARLDPSKEHYQHALITALGMEDTPRLRWHLGYAMSRAGYKSRKDRDRRTDRGLTYYSQGTRRKPGRKLAREVPVSEKERQEMIHLKRSGWGWKALERKFQVDHTSIRRLLGVRRDSSRYYGKVDLTPYKQGKK